VELTQSGMNGLTVTFERDLTTTEMERLTARLTEVGARIELAATQPQHAVHIDPADVDRLKTYAALEDPSTLTAVQLTAVQNAMKRVNQCSDCGSARIASNVEGQPAHLVCGRLEASGFKEGVTLCHPGCARDCGLTGGA
jgi:hypothetical protein